MSEKGEANMNLFADIQLPCACSQSCAECICGPEEKILRHYASGQNLRPMTAEEREWCVTEADQAGEGAYNREEMKNLSDRDLANTTLSAWSDYVKSHF